MNSENNNIDFQATSQSDTAEQDNTGPFLKLINTRDRMNSEKDDMDFQATSPSDTAEQDNDE